VAKETRENLSIFEPTVTDLGSHLADLSANEELWENNGWLLRLESATGEEFMIWSCIYAIKGTPGGNFTVEEAAFPQTLLTYGKFEGDRRQRLNDTDFTVGGIHYSEYLRFEDMRVEEVEGGVTWEVGGRIHSAKPPHWKLQGTSVGVTLDLELEAIGPISRVGAFRFIEGMEVTARVRGFVEVRGERHEVTGWGQHEKFHLPNPDMLHAAQGIGPWPGGEWWQWHCGFSDELQVFMQLEPIDKNGYGRVLHKGQLYAFEYADVRCDEVQHWTDPKNGVVAPSRWHVNFTNSAACLDLTSWAYSRVYYLWDYMKGGYNLLYWLQGDAEGVFYAPDGEVVKFTSMKYLTHTKRNFLRFPHSR
jgi:hypothetical protein